MILNNFAAIILKRKELKPLFKIFIKQYQQEIVFIEQTMKQDAEEIKREATCCYCMFRWMSCFRRQISAKFEMCNPEFYRVFSAMGAVKRQEYLIQLLNHIQLLGEAYHQYSQKKEKQEEPNINQYKTHISTVLIEKFISKNVINELEIEEQQQVCLGLLVVIDGIKSQKVGRFKKNFKFQLIEKKHGVQEKIVVNLRNYLIVSFSMDTLTISVSAIYQTISPLDVEISFNLHQSDKKYEKYVRIFTEITKLGKIQKLIRNIDLVKVFGKEFSEQADKMDGKHSNFLKTFVKQEQDMEYYHQKNYIDSQDIIRNTVNTQKKIKRLQTIKNDQYLQVKRRLIQTLNVLSEKKEKQNERVKSFLKKPAISRPKQKSEAIERVLKSTEAFVPRKLSIEKRLSIEELPRELYNFVSNFENQDQKLSIINRYNEQAKSKSGREKHDSFFVDNNEFLSHTDQKFNRLFRQSQSHVVKKVEYNRNIYNKLYPENFKFARIESLIEMIHVEFKQFYLMPEQDVAKQSNNLATDKLAKFKLNWLDKLTKTVRVYCRKQSPNFIKIFIPLGIEIRSLVKAMVNVEAYPLWHPNIKNVEIVSSISTENAIIYRMQVINPITNKPYTMMMLMHLFRLEGKYYIIQKSIQDLKKENKSRGILSFFHSKKSSNNFSKLNFLMMRISNTNQNGFCEMTISLDYQPVQDKMASNARKQQMTLFVNYIFIVNFWKLSAEKKGLNMGIFNYDWTVALNSFEEQSRVSVRDQQPDIFNDARVEISRLVERDEQKENIQSSSQLIHSSEFYDV